MALHDAGAFQRVWNDHRRQGRKTHAFREIAFRGGTGCRGTRSAAAEPIKTIFNAQDIPVVITDIGIRSGKYISLIITDNLKGGEQAGEYMAKLVPKGSKVITLDHAPTNDNGQTRQKGFEAKAKELG